MSEKEKKIKQISNAYLISRYFGFESITPLKISKEEKAKATQIKKNSVFHHHTLPPIEEPMAILNKFKEVLNKRSPSEPLMFYCEGVLKEDKDIPKIKGAKKTLDRKVNLHVIGSPKSITEALLIKTTLCILTEEGYGDVTLEINNVGGKEALSTFNKEITAYYRKNMGEMSSNCRQLFKDSTHSLILCKDELKSEVVDLAPSPLNFLNEANRNHFKEVVEYLESHKISYEINKDILGDPHYSTHTIFTILDKKTGKILATGTRYNNLAKKIGFKRDTPGMSVAINLKQLKKVPESLLPKKDKIKFFFIQIGPEAKRKSLQVIDELRKAKIPVATHLGRDKMSTQMEQVGRYKASYIILMGQREAMTNSVVVRNMINHKQDNVAIKDLSTYLKKLK